MGSLEGAAMTASSPCSSCGPGPCDGSCDAAPTPRPLPALPSGALVRRRLPDGRVVGSDYDGRLQALERSMELLEIPRIVAGGRVLDLGCNAGHWPAKYLDWGAASVTGVEGRGEFRETFNLVTRGGAEFVEADVRTYVPDQPHDILSALGLIYHLRSPWPVIRRLYDKCCAKLAIVEAQIYPFCWMNAEKASDGSMALEDGETARLTRDAFVAGAEGAGFELCAEVSGMLWGGRQPLGVVGSEETRVVNSTRALWVFRNAHPVCRWEDLTKPR